jgi:hypothetical protein
MRRERGQIGPAEVMPAPSMAGGRVGERKPLIDECRDRRRGFNVLSVFMPALRTI